MNDHLEEMVCDVVRRILEKLIYMILFSLIQRKSCTQDALTLRDCQQL